MIERSKQQIVDRTKRTTVVGDEESCSSSSSSACSLPAEGAFEDETGSFAAEGNNGAEANVNFLRGRLGEGRQGSKVVYVVLLVAAVGFSLATYFLLAASQQREFEAEFYSLARETADIAEANAESTFGQLQSLATAITSVAKTTAPSPGRLEGSSGRARFPNVTVPHFDLRSQEIADLTGAEMIMFVPFVDKINRRGWEEYAVAHQAWIKQDYEYRDWDVSRIEPIPGEIYPCPKQINDTRRGFVDDGFMERTLANLSYVSDGFSAPVAQFGPGPTDSSLVMMDMFTHQIFKKEIISSLEYDVPVVSEAEDLDFLLKYIAPRPNGTSTNKKLLRSFTLDPVKEDFRKDSKTIGFIVGILPWQSFFANIMPPSVNGFVVKVESDCGQNFTYVINGGRDDWAELGDHYDIKYQHMNLTHRSKFFWKDHPVGTSRHCHFDLVVFPSDEFAAAYESSMPALYAGIVVAVFAFTAVLFFAYSYVVSRRQQQVLNQAATAEALVTSLFPEHVGERLIAEARKQEADAEGGGKWGKRGSAAANSKANLQDFLTTGGDGGDTQSKPIADLFPTTTIMFADIVGFTAWSSTRSPDQVFTLLETIYKKFDKLANRRRIFKVETVGDCYVAVAGLPTPRKDHHIAMCRFAGDCLTRMGVLVQQLSIQLGPGTEELGIRIGLHSGPVTAGVLRGERARFQLFGDTVNTTARIESTGQRNRIHISKETSDLLAASGKSHWFTPRMDKVAAKGKGELTTFWLDIKSDGDDNQSIISGGSLDDYTSSRKSDSSYAILSASDKTKVAGFSRSRALKKKQERLVNWNVEQLAAILKQIQERRQVMGIPRSSDDVIRRAEVEQLGLTSRGDKTVLDEVVEIIELPSYTSELGGKDCAVPSKPVQLDEKVASQLYDYVYAVSCMYNDNPFHNFEHASHVTSSVVKLLSRIVAPDLPASGASRRDLHDHTYGITSDPLTQFSVVLSALLHDVDHDGVPNATLVKEGASVAKMYKNKSVAEQNSVDLAWNLLMQESYGDLRRAIYATEAEFKRFRQLVVNTILATDIMDKELKNLRNARWSKAFSASTATASASPTVESTERGVNRKATIVIEHLIQASDVAHTMQHWHVYRKWNAKLFQEMYRAYQDGRAENDPAESWYEGEIGFLDFYVIPLAKKLKDCGVFGVSSDEYLNYAEQNRREWELKGRGVVAELVESVSGGNHDDEDIGLSEQPQDSTRCEF